MYPNQYDYYFEAYALEHFAHLLPWQWFKAQAIAESGLNPEAVSPVGATGVMQLMPGTAEEMAHVLGIIPFKDFSLVPHLNIRMGIAYDRQCWDIWKNETGVERIRFMLGSYNAGRGNILDAQRLAKRSGLATNHWMSIASALPAITGRHSQETISYVKRIESFFSELTKESKS